MTKLELLRAERGIGGFSRKFLSETEIFFDRENFRIPRTDVRKAALARAGQSDLDKLTGY